MCLVEAGIPEPAKLIKMLRSLYFAKIKMGKESSRSKTQDRTVKFDGALA
jgi:hypothetical protein